MFKLVVGFVHSFVLCCDFYCYLALECECECQHSLTYVSVLAQVGLGHCGPILVRLMWADAWTEMGNSLEPIGPKWVDRSGHYFQHANLL